MKTLRYALLGAALMGCLMTTANAVILPPTDDTSGTLTYNTAKPPVVTKRTLTSANGSSGSLPVSRTRTAFIRFAVEETGLTAGNLGKARLTLYFPSVTKAGDLSLHVVTQDWDENFPLPEKSRVHPAFEEVPFLTIPASSVVRRQFVIIDVTEQVREALASPGTRFGFAVTSPGGIANIAIGSKEGSGTGYPPLLEMEADGAVLAVNALAAVPPGMVLIPAGAFTMGDSLLGDALPVSTTVSAFYMDVNEVTQSQWDAVYVWAIDHGYSFAVGAGKGVNHPVQTVSWYDCVKWCNARSEQAGRTPVYYTDDAQTTIYKTGNVDVTNAQAKWTANGYRLPTEAEWEKAARGGLSGQRFPWGMSIKGGIANYFGATGSFAYDLGPNGFNPTGSIGGTNPATSPVGSFAANGYGLNDMAGNVSEWCWDWYGTPYAGGTDPRGATTVSLRVIRGSSWGSFAGNARCAFRNDFSPLDANSIIGFRAVLPPGQ